MSIAYSIHNKRFSIFDQKLLILLLVVYVCLLLPQIRVQYPQFQWVIIIFPIKQQFGWYTTQKDTQTKTVYCWSIISLYSIKISQLIPMISALNIYIIHQISRHISRFFLYIPWTVHLFHLLFIWGSNNCVSSLPAFDMLRMLTCCKYLHVQMLSHVHLLGVGGDGVVY